MTPKPRISFAPLSLLACAALVAAGSLAFAAPESDKPKPAKSASSKAKAGEKPATAKPVVKKTPAKSAVAAKPKAEDKAKAKAQDKAKAKDKAKARVATKPAPPARSIARPAAKSAAKPVAKSAAAPRTAARVPAPRPRPTAIAPASAATAFATPDPAASAPPAPTGNAMGRFLASAVPTFMPSSVGATSEAVPPQSPPPTPSPLSYGPAAPATATDIDNVKEAINLARRGKVEAATERRDQIRDMAGQKLVEWMILRSNDSGAGFARYAAFARANPAWPSVGMIRRRAEGQLWSEKREPGAVFAYFSNQEPLSARGKLALARAALAQGDRAAAQENARDAWRNEDFGADLEGQVLETFGGLLSRADHKARMDVRLYDNDNDTALRAAKRLGGSELAIAHARIAVNRKAGNARALLDAVPSDARGDAGYIFSRAQWLRRHDEVGDAAKLLLSAPRDAAVLHNTNEWWIERRLVARKMLDEGEAQTAYRIASGAARPEKENLAVEQLFTAGWIALRFLNDPNAATRHFRDIQQVSRHPTSLARGSYWLGRAAEAAGRTGEARGHYETAAQHSAAYYGQLARARLGHREIAVRRPPALSGAERASLRNADVVRAFELLYATDNRDLVIPFVADLDRIGDVGALTLLAETAGKHDDARAMLMIGKSALARGYAFDHYAFPSAGIPKFASIGPDTERSLVFAIARQESAFNPRAMSSARAMGLMQVTPSTGRVIARKWGVAFSEKKLLGDPVYNAQMGAAEIGHLVRDYDGNHVLAFVGYNAGRGRVKEWIERYGDPRSPNVDAVDWVERIPFSETRNYVQRVMENMQVYRARFGSGARLAIEADMRGARQ